MSFTVQSLKRHPVRARIGSRVSSRTGKGCRRSKGAKSFRYQQASLLVVEQALHGFVLHCQATQDILSCAGRAPLRAADASGAVAMRMWTRMHPRRPSGYPALRCSRRPSHLQRTAPAFT